MLVKIAVWIAILICTVKTVGYGMYVLKKNKTGALALFVMALLTAACSAVFV